MTKFSHLILAFYRSFALSNLFLLFEKCSRFSLTSGSGSGSGTGTGCGTGSGSFGGSFDRSFMFEFVISVKGLPLSITSRALLRSRI